MSRSRLVIALLGVLSIPTLTLDGAVASDQLTTGGFSAPQDARRFKKHTDLAAFRAMPILVSKHSTELSVPMGQIVRYDLRTGVQTITETSVCPSSASGASEPGPSTLLRSAAATESLDVLSPEAFGGRLLVADTMTYPESAVSRLLMTFHVPGLPDAGFGCSAALVGPRHLLTAAHCVYAHDDGNGHPINAWAFTAFAAPGYDRSETPFGTADAVAFFTWTNWIADGALGYDLAVVELDRAVGGIAGQLQIASSSVTCPTSSDCPPYTTSVFRHAGYPGEEGYDFEQMYVSTGDYDFVQSEELGYDPTGIHGESGSPSYILDAATVYGVLSHTHCDFPTGCDGYDTRITDAKRVALESFIAQRSPTTCSLVPLAVETSTTSIAAGSSLADFSYTVVNDSTTRCGGTHIGRVYLSTDPTISADDRLLHTVGFQTSLEPKASLVTGVGESTPVVIPCDIASSGTYWLGVIVDGVNATDSQDAQSVYVEGRGLVNLSVTTTAGGIVSPQGLNLQVCRGLPVTIRAKPNCGFAFTQWTGSGRGSYSGTSNPVTIVPDGGVSEHATFQQVSPSTAAVSLDTIPTGLSVMVDGTAVTSPSTSCWLPGSSHTISVDPLVLVGDETRHSFVSWSDGGAATHSIVAPLTGAATVTATYLTEYVLTMEAGAGGTVEPQTGWFAKGVEVDVTADGACGHRFDRWEGSGRGSYDGRESQATIRMEGPIQQRAEFNTVAPGLRSFTEPTFRDLDGATVDEWVDQDGDGDLDLWISGWSVESHLLRNDGAGRFTEVTVGAIGALGRDIPIVDWVDVDGDGDPDLWMGGNGSQLLRNDGDSSFTDVTDGTISSLSDVSYSNWADFDADGDPDLLVGGVGTTGRLLRNDGAFRFSDVPGMALDAVHGIILADWVDADGDGDLDLFVGGGSRSQLYRNDGGASFTLQGDGPLSLIDNPISTTWIDFDGDGDVDLWVMQEGEDAALFRNAAALSFSRVTAGDLDQLEAYTTSAWGDMDGDGDPDLWAAAGDGGTEGRLFRNDGALGFTDVTAGGLANQYEVEETTWVDFDNDGDLDLWLAGTSRDSTLLVNLGFDFGLGLFLDSGMDLPSSAHDFAWFDLDNDGDLDLWLLASDEQRRVFRNDGGAFPLFVITPTSTDDLASLDRDVNGGWIDTDSDGDLDLWADQRSNEPALLENDSFGCGNHWLRVQLSGPSLLASGTAATVRVDGHVRQVGACAKGFSECLSGGHFGLRDQVVVGELEVRWPDGQIQTLTSIPADQVVRLFENDQDGDGVEGPSDNCPGTSNPDQVDRDGDRVGDACDNCLLVANSDQADANSNGTGDLCEGPGPGDADGDGIVDSTDNCGSVLNPTQADRDADGFGDHCDNCPLQPNPGQDDEDGDRVGNFCSNPIVNANVNDLGSSQARIDGSDLFALARVFGTCGGHALFDPGVDLDRSGCIDGVDLSVLGSVWASEVD